MNSPRGTAKTPARWDRDSSISPQPLEPVSDTCLTPFSGGQISVSEYTHNLVDGGASSLFANLPSTAISRILWSVDANTFASLCILNRKWWQEAQRVELYAHHLSRCPSYALSNNIISGPFRRNDLLRLKARFADEVRRNLFDAFLRPRRTLLNLISINANSSAAFPAGEAFRFEFSPNGRTILALSSSRIYVLDATVDPPAVLRHLKTLRRPLSASVTDDGSLLAVLSSKHQVNIYGLTPQGVQHLQVIVLDHPPKIIAIAHEGTVLAASFETGIEVFSLAANCLTTDRRAVRSEAVDTLNFSGDGSMLVGSSLNLDEPNAVVISAPFYTENDPDLSSREIHSRMWTTQILFPQISSVCSHVALLPGHIEGDACWLFAYDHSLMSYRAVRTDDTRAGVAYFLSPPGADRFDTPMPTFSPSASACGTLVVAGFEGEGLCLYGVPERLDISPDMGAVIERQNERQTSQDAPLTSATGIADPLMAYSPSTFASDYFIEDDSIASKVDWRQSLFVKCKSVRGLAGQTAARWVEHSDGSNTLCNKRLVVVAPGGVSLDADDFGDEGMPVDGSRMCLLDFDYVPSILADRILTIEVGEEEPELLTEHTGSLAAEVALERRRTIRAIPTAEVPRVPLGRSITSITPPSGSLLEDGFRRGSISSPSSPTEQSRGSQSYAASSLHRSVTASGFRHARYPPRPPLGSSQYMSQSHHAYSGGPHQGRPTSEDSWETPPPPYAGGNNPLQQYHPLHGRLASTSEQPEPSTVALDMGRTAGSPQSHYRPYRSIVAERRSATLDAIMSSNAIPSLSGPAISQYEELMLAARPGRLSESSLDGGAAQNRSISPDVESNSTSPFMTGAPAEHPRRARPMTHHGAIPESWLPPRRSTSMPISPVSPDEVDIPVNGHNAIDSASPIATSRISLTGANLQNRLNHPVPPIPESPSHPSAAAQKPGIQNVHGFQTSFQQHEEVNVETQMPTADQMANLHRHVSLSEMQRPPGVKNTNFVHRGPTAIDTPSPPRAAWGAAGVPGSPTFNQARNVPDGFSRPRSNSKEGQTSHLASASAPNLLTQRPVYSRLDTIDSVTDVNGYVETDLTLRNHTHSMTQPNMTLQGEPSAYHETSRAGPGNFIGKHGKKSKKKKDESGKKGSRCTVM